VTAVDRYGGYEDAAAAADVAYVGPTRVANPSDDGTPTTEL